MAWLPERDGHTDRQTDRQTHSMTAKAALAYHRAGGKIGRQNIKSIK